MIHRLVIKIGSAVLRGRLNEEEMKIDQAVVADITHQIHQIQGQGVEVVLVSSGSVLAGKIRLLELGMDLKCFSNAQIAAIGARHLMNLWGDAFEKYQKEVSLCWVTHANWDEPEEKENIKSSTISFLLEREILPIVNENDLIAREELIQYERLTGERKNGKLELNSVNMDNRMIGENDKLAWMTASLINADGLILITEYGGIFEDDPRINKKARRYAGIDLDNFPAELQPSTSASPDGRGGPDAKLAYAITAFQYGIRTAVAGIQEPDVIIKFTKGLNVGTMIGQETRFHLKT